MKRSPKVAGIGKECVACGCCCRGVPTGRTVYRFRRDRPAG